MNHNIKSALGHNKNSLICNVSEDELRELYLIQKKSAPQIAEIYDCSINQVKARLNKFKIRKPEVDKCKSGKGNLLTTKNLIEMYKIHNIDQIAEIIGVSSPAIRGHFLRKGIRIDKEHSLSKRRVNPNSIKAILENRMSWEDRPQEQKDAFMYSKSKGMLGQNHSEAARAKMSVEGAKRIERLGQMSKAEKKAKSILDELKIKNDPQKFIEIKDQRLLWGVCADFILKDLPIKTILFVDSRYHHNIKENVLHDSKTNNRLMQNGYLVIRLWNDEVSKSRIISMIRKAYSAKKPALLRYRYPDKYKKYCPKAYLKTNTKISHIPFEALYGFYYKNCYIPCP